MSDNRVARAAQWLMAQNEARRPFEPLAGELRPADMNEAYAVQDELVRLRCAAWNTTRAGYKIALTTPAMRKFVGYGDSIAGQVLARNVHTSPAALKLADYVHLGFECELAFLLGADLPPGEPDRQSVGAAIAAVAPAFELVDDRGADYAAFASDGGASALSLAADNAWNAG